METQETYLRQDKAFQSKPFDPQIFKQKITEKWNFLVFCDSLTQDIPKK